MCPKNLVKGLQSSMPPSSLDLPLQTFFLLQVTFQRLRVQVNVYQQVIKSNSVPLILKHMGSDSN